jgi:Amiloride-sensitive sodium channel
VTGIKALEKEMEDSLNCPDCLPLCSSTYFSTDFLKTNLNEESYYLSKFADKKNLSVLHIYLASPDSLLYKTKVKLTWYDVLSNFGGMLGLFMGFSLISLAEVVYFSTLRLYQNLMEMHLTKKNVDINFYRQNIFKKQTYSDVEMKLMSAYDRKNRGYTFMN